MGMGESRAFGTVERKGKKPSIPRLLAGKEGKRNQEKRKERTLISVEK